MGPEEESNPQLYFKNGDEWTPVDSVKSDTIDFMSDFDPPELFATLTKTEYPNKIEFKLCDGLGCYTKVCPKYPRKMTSKKYKKWLMSIGMTRNDADILCYIIGSLKGKVSYSDIYGINYGLLLISGESPSFLDILQSIIIKGATKTNGRRIPGTEKP